MSIAVEPIPVQLDRLGPERCEPLDVEAATAYCRTLCRSRSENFSVLSSLVPEPVRDDFAAIYAFCRWADDLGDELGSTERSLEMLAWWRTELDACYAGEPRHPVFVALAPVIRSRAIPAEPFEALIGAFERDQRQLRWESWADVLEYCRGSADPVGRLVLMVLGEERDALRFEPSDRICTALQLTNHWQDVRRDLLERDRIYLPRELVRDAFGDDVETFEEKLRRSAQQGWAVDPAFLEATRSIVRTCVERTWPLFEDGAVLLDRIDERSRPVIRLFLDGGTSVLRAIEDWNFETALHRPRLTKPRRAWLVARAWFEARRRARAGAGA